MVQCVSKRLGVLGDSGGKEYPVGLHVYDLLGRLLEGVVVVRIVVGQVCLDVEVRVSGGCFPDAGLHSCPVFTGFVLGQQAGVSVVLLVASALAYMLG